MRGALALCLLAMGCDAEVDFIVDASNLTGFGEGTTLYVDLVRNAETWKRVIVDVDNEPVVTVPDLIQIGVAYGVAAFLDGDADGACASEADAAWLFEYAGVYNEPFLWEVRDGEFSDPLGCAWFAGVDLSE